MRISRAFSAVAAVLAVFVVSSGNARASAEELTALHVGTHGVDLGYLMMPDEVKDHQASPMAAELSEIIHSGARALDWVDLLQRDVPPAQREQIWRKIDRVGHEPTPDAPMKYNPEIILEAYRKALSDAPPAVVQYLRGNDALPATPPPGLTIKDVVDAVRPVHVTYSRASRWLVLYDWRFSLDKGSRDLRGWLKVDRERDALKDLTTRWATLSRAERERFVAEVAEVCPITVGDSAEECRSEHVDLTRSDKAGAAALSWLNDLHAKGRREYNSRFGVLRTHAGVRLKTEGGLHKIEMPTTGIAADVFNWIQERVTEAWSFPGATLVTLFNASPSATGVVKVRWQKGALPNVNGIAGDVITMDANTPKWLEHTQIVMRHEFGHVLGFPDCYTEFWDEAIESFTYYSLDPSDAMCALSGDYLDRHREALLKGYFAASETE